MPSISNVLQLFAASDILRQVPRRKDMLSGIAVIIGLVVITGMMVGALLIGLLYMMYSSLVIYSTLSATHSALLTGVFALLITASLVAIIIKRVKKLVRSPEDSVNPILSSIPGATTVNNVAHSFIDGFMLRDKPKTRR